MAWDDLPTDDQEKRIGQYARILGQDVEIYYPIANRWEARAIMFDLLNQIRSRNIARRISKEIVGD